MTVTSVEWLAPLACCLDPVCGWHDHTRTGRCKDKALDHHDETGHPVSVVESRETVYQSPHLRAVR